MAELLLAGKAILHTLYSYQPKPAIHGTGQLSGTIHDLCCSEQSFHFMGVLMDDGPTF